MTAGPAPRRHGLPARLARLGFTGVDAAAATITSLGLADADGTYDPAAALVLDALAGTADPDAALAGLDRIVGVAPHPADLLSALRAHDGLRRRLLTVLGASDALAHHLLRHPEDWLLLADDALTTSRPSALGLRTTLLAAVGAGDDPQALARLRSAYLRCLLSLAARDLIDCADVDEVAAELADLAAAALDAALVVATRALPPEAAPVRLAVIGMGKCGGRELNYSSDVDVVLVAEPVGPAGPDTDVVDAALATGTALARGLIRAVGPEGAGLFPLDTALRPEGKAGPLVRSLASHVAYQSRWAQPWEHQAQLKARPVAGDRELGAAYVTAMAPLLWSPDPRAEVPGQVQAMRRRVESLLPPAAADRELKLGPGGLRDVEFAVQLLQLVHGRTDATLRLRGTLPALEALAAGGYVGREDAGALASAYRDLRTAEHRLQLQALRRTHLVPPLGDPRLRRLARSLGYRADAAAAYDADRRRAAAVVRRLHERIFYAPLLAAVARLPGEAARLSPEAAGARLEALGFRQPRQALAHLQAMTSGVSRRAAIQRTLLPVLLGWMAEEADPDAGLLAFRRLSDSLGSTPWYLRSLRDEGQVAERLAHLVTRSRYVADLLARAPEAMLLLADDEALAPRSPAAVAAEALAVAARAEVPETAVAVVRALRRGELLRTACADLLGLVESAQVQAALSGLAGATVAAALQTATQVVAAMGGAGGLPVRVAVLALGRLGGGELSYGSDADVVFVHEGVAGADPQAVRVAAAAVAEQTRRLLALPSPDPPLLLDAGLRPEGRAGALTLSLEALARYHATRGQVWEQQALLRAAPLAGDADLTARVLAQIAPVRWPQRLPPEAEAEVVRLRDRVQSERVAPGLPRAQRWRDLKLGWGGLADVEWTAQLLQLRAAAAVPALRTTSTGEALRAAAQAGLLAADEASVLLAGHATASRLRDAVVLVTGRRSDVLPDPGPTLDGVRRVAGAVAVDGWEAQSRAVRAVAEEVLRGRRRGKVAG